MAVTTVELPKSREYLWPTVCALRAIGGSATIEEINTQVIADQGYTEEQQAVLHGNGPGTAIEYRLAWARTYLKGMGLAFNSERGVWNLTERGRTVTEEEIGPLRKQYRAQHRKRSVQERSKDTSPDEDAEEITWQEELLDELMRLTPDNFERLSQRLLREEGFANTRVTGRTGDGGIDGQGVYRLSLLSFHVFFQCKRYVGSVGASAVRDFRGAMAGRGDKGLLITTGTFTNGAKAEATRDGAPPIDLIDGYRLCELLKERQLGVDVRLRTVEEITVDADFFRSGF